MWFAIRTLRGKIVLVFAICFVFMGFIIGVTYRNAHLLDQFIEFFERATDMKNTILEMRRYEKNYFLFKDDFSYQENITYANTLEMLSLRYHESLVKDLGRKNYNRFLNALKEYVSFMNRVRQFEDPQENIKLQAEIRERGRRMLLLADQLFRIQKTKILKLLNQLLHIPLLLVIVLLVLMGFVTYFLANRIVQPLRKITADSVRIAKGDFHDISLKDVRSEEVRSLVTALNRMVKELETRHEQLVQSRKIAALGTLTSGVAHELNNPINNISLTVESITEDYDDLSREEVLQLLKETMEQADRASDIIRNLLEFSRTSRRTIETVSLEELVDKTLKLVGNELKAHRIRTRKTVKGVIPLIQCDRNAVQQVFLNLFINAYQAMPKGGYLIIRFFEPDKRNELRVEVEDTGPGVDPEVMEQIFDPFFTTKTEGGGTGLGLSVSYNIMKQHGGRLEVKSEQGKGTVFTVIFSVSGMSHETL